MSESLSPFLRRLLELIAAECAPTADRWEDRLARRFRAEFESPPDGPRGFDVVEAMFHRLQAMERVVAPSPRGRPRGEGAKSRNYS